MQVKRRLSYDGNMVDDASVVSQAYVSGSFHHRGRLVAKRARVAETIASRPPSHDIISVLPPELLVRVFSYMNETILLEMSTVSRLFYRIASDHQLWRKHFYRRFVLPAAHYNAGNKGKAQRSSVTKPRGGRVGSKDEGKVHEGDYVDWKKAYKLRHNWARGRCDIEKLPLDTRVRSSTSHTLIKVFERLAITVDETAGLMVWDLSTRTPMAHVNFEPYRRRAVRPTCLAVDDEPLSCGVAGIAIGFEDSTFGVWKLDLATKELVKVCRYDTGCFAKINDVAYCSPYVLLSAGTGLITLWTLDSVISPWYDPDEDGFDSEEESVTSAEMQAENKSNLLRRPWMLRSLCSHNTKEPLTLSMRRVATSVIASIVYTLNSMNGWCIGVQDFDIRPTLDLPEIKDSRLAFSVPTHTRGLRPSSTHNFQSHSCPDEQENSDDDGDGPIGLCYSHPYLLATLPDNTLMLHICHSYPDTLSISPGIRLWGHTSGISDAEITARGKAVSVSARGDEVRVWELEGRIGGSSVEVVPRQHEENDMNRLRNSSFHGKLGFNEEIIIVLKEGLDGKDSLVVYDFT